MQATKLTGIIDTDGKLIINEPINLSPGEVEIIVLKTGSENSENNPQNKPFKSKVKAFEGLFDNTEPLPPNFDPDQAKWEYLKEKHNIRKS